MSWEEVEIGAVANVLPGFAFKSGHLGDEGIPVIKIGDITDGGEVNLTDVQRLPDSNLEPKHEKFRLANRDILLAMTGATAGKTGRISAPDGATFLLNQRVAKIEPNAVDPDFFWHVISTKAYRERFFALGGGAAQPNMSGSQIAAIKIPLPPNTVQQEISGALSAYDELMENNRRRIALLEAAARLLYREWFVHFRFPGHEHVKVIDGLPEGWVRRTLVELAEVVMGQSPKSQFYNNAGEGLPFHQGVTDYGFRFVSHRIYSTAVTKIAEAGDILVSVRAPVGRINITRNRIVLGRGLAAIRSRTEHQSFLFYALKNHFYAEDIIGTGAIYAATNKKELEGQIFLGPPALLLREFEDQVSTIDLQIACLESQNHNLVQARDLLLPRLMNGEIAV